MTGAQVEQGAPLVGSTLPNGATVIAVRGSGLRSASQEDGFIVLCLSPSAPRAVQPFVTWWCEAITWNTTGGHYFYPEEIAEAVEDFKRRY